MKNVKTIEFRLAIEGNGIVNFDDGNQKFIFNGSNLKHLQNIHNNVSYGKKNIYRDEDGNLDYKTKISSNSLRHSIFKDSVFNQNPNIMSNDDLLTGFIASPMALLRGYLFATKKSTIKHKGALTITSAEQTSNGRSKLETFTKSGEKTENSLFSKETIGDITYEASGFLNVQELQFLGCDATFDRYGLNPDYFETYKTMFSNRHSSYDGELGYYQLKNSDVRIPEYGVKISNDMVVYLTKWMLERIKSYHVLKNDAYARTAKLEYRYITDGVNHNANPWTEINSHDDINNISFVVDERYVAVDFDEAKELRDQIDEVKLKETADKKQAKMTKEKGKK